jgi:hypothetical protein
MKDIVVYRQKNNIRISYDKLSRSYELNNPSLIAQRIVQIMSECECRVGFDGLEGWLVDEIIRNVRDITNENKCG